MSGSAIGRPLGNLTVDGNGLSRYQYPIEVPPGIGAGNAPQLALVYTHGAPNGIIGKGWAIAGLSAIRLAKASLAFDGINNPPGYDRNQLRLSLDGGELLNTKGDYMALDAEYRTELEDGNQLITACENYFLVHEPSGMKAYYGSTEDSRLLLSDGSRVKEWLLKKRVDKYGNCVTYNYVTSPQKQPTARTCKDEGTSYIESIVYTSNENTGHPGQRIVMFEYASRDDPVIMTQTGDRVVQAHLLSAVRIGFQSGQTREVLRSYELTYTSSLVTRSSLLAAIKETANDAQQSQLTPTKFTYTGSLSTPEGMFVTEPQNLAQLKSRNNYAVLPMNISGRALTDLAVIRYDGYSNALSVKTFLAQTHSTENPNQTRFKWESSEAADGTANLPFVEITQESTPKFLGADLSGDGRMDLIVPFKDKNDMLSFSISQSTGKGYMPFRIKPTKDHWSDDSSFIASDLDGNGYTDVIQIFPDQNKLAFRVFSAVNQDGVATLKDAKSLRTRYDFSATIQWLEAAMQRDNSRSLVRIHSTEDRRGFVRLEATTFALHKSPDIEDQLKEIKTSALGTFPSNVAPKLSVFASDVNGDGVQDIITCLTNAQSRGQEYDIEFSLTTFLNDGVGGFSKLGETTVQNFTVPISRRPLKPGTFHVTNIHGADYPSLCYAYQEANSKDFVAVVFQGSSSGTLGKYQFYRLAESKSLPPGEVTITATDIAGTNLGGWLLQSVQDDVITICPVYNTGTSTDFLSSSRDSMGLLSEVEYSSMSNQSVYESSQRWESYALSKVHDEYPILSSAGYVVSKINMRNDPEVNAFPFSNSISKKYFGARVNLRGRGWKGFEQVKTYNASQNATVCETFYQEWPLAGTQKQIDTLEGNFTEGKILQSQKFEYSSAVSNQGQWKIFKVHKTREQTDMINNGTVASTAGSLHAYDNDGNLVSTESWDSSLRRLWTTFKYKRIGPVLSLPSHKKVTTRKENVNMLAFEDGDLSLTVADFHPNTGFLRDIAEWSSSHNTFVKTSYEFDAYGNEIRRLDPLGLDTRTQYDDHFHAHPVAISETGTGVNITTFAAFDIATGKQVAIQESSGAVTCIVIDAFGRSLESNKLSGGEEEGSRSSKQVLKQKVISSEAFTRRLESSQFTPHQESSTETYRSSLGIYLFARVTSYHKNGREGRVERQDYVDCVGKIRKSSTKQGGADSSWIYSEFDSRGLKTLQSYPTKIPGDVDKGLSWMPERSLCVTSTYDGLGRPILQQRPGHDDSISKILTEVSYLEGGERVRKVVSEVSKSDGATTRLSTTEKRFKQIHQELKPVEDIDENQAKTSFHWDELGRLTLVTDAGGKKESRIFDSLGNLIKTNDAYRNEVLRKYDLGNNLVEEVNALGQATRYTYDCKGRVQKATAHDGRIRFYEYSQTGQDHLQSIKLYQSDEAVNPTSTYTFDFDDRGRLKRKTTFIFGHNEYRYTYSYDWQDKVVKKSLPDGSSIVQEYDGALLNSSRLEGSGWRTQVTYDQYSSFEKPEKWSFSSNLPSGTRFSSIETYNGQGFPTSCSTSARSALVDARYSFNSLDKLSQVQDTVSGETTKYDYVTGRLSAVQKGQDSTFTYQYDASGNLTRNKDMNLQYLPGKVVARDGTNGTLEVEYDAAGRMLRRASVDRDFDFSYDGFGNMTTITNKSAGKVTTLLHDYKGHVVVKTRSDGTQEHYIDRDFEVLIRPDGSRRIKRKHFGFDRILAVVWTDIPVCTTTGLAAKQQTSVRVLSTDTKGNVTHIFNNDGTLCEELVYDPFGRGGISKKENNSTTYEGNKTDEDTGLIDFKARWYDPVLGRFATPDNILDEKSLLLTDGLNRYAFENNDPINHVDPTGHWSWFATVGLVIGVVALVAATILTFGAAGVIAGMAAGFLFGFGAAATLYSAQHHDEKDWWTFAKGYTASAVVSGVIGLITGGVGGWIASASGNIGRAITSALLRSIVRHGVAIAGQALASAMASTAVKLVNNSVERYIHGRKDVNLTDGLGTAFLIGLAFGAVTGGIGAGVRIVRNMRIAQAQRQADPGVVNYESPLADPERYGVRLERGFVNHRPLNLSFEDLRFPEGAR